MKKIQITKEFNKQINEELYSSYLYLSMAGYFHTLNLDGFANWLKVQAQEEAAHAMKFFDFLQEIGETVELQAIAKPETKWASPQAAFAAVCKHEEYISSRIHSLFALTAKENHYPAQIFLHWFIKEQVEEEATAQKVLFQLEKTAKNDGALLMLDRAMGTRKSGAS